MRSSSTFPAAAGLSLPATTFAGTSSPYETPSVNGRKEAVPPATWHATHLPFHIGWMVCW